MKGRGSFYNQESGFTLMELLIVVIIIGILASLAIPRFVDAAKRAKELEAKSVLAAIRKSQERYCLEHGIYHHDIYVTDGTILDISVDVSSYYEYTAVGGIPQPIDPVTGLPLIAEACARMGTGLSSFHIDQAGTITACGP